MEEAFIMEIISCYTDLKLKRSISLLVIFELSCYLAKDFCEKIVLELGLSFLVLIIQFDNNIFQIILVQTICFDSILVVFINNKIIITVLC